MYDILRKKVSQPAANPAFKRAASLQMLRATIVTPSCNAYEFAKEEAVFVPFKTNVPVDEKGLDAWIDYMNACGFPCKREKDFSIERYKIVVRQKDCVSQVHYRAAITAVRYLWYGLCLSDSYINTAKRAMELFSSTKKTPLTALLEAHADCMPKSNTQYDAAYTVKAHALNLKPKPVLKSQMLEKAKTALNVNSLFPE